MRKLRNIWAFYISTVLINFGISIGAALFGGLGAFTTGFLGFGFALSLAVKEVNSKNGYIFYQNNGLGRFKLWASAYIINIFVSLAIFAILITCQNIFSK